MLKVSVEKEPPGRVRYLSEEEFERLHDACSEWLKPIVLTAKHTGMRREEILSLKWTQVNLITGIIHLAKTKNHVAQIAGLKHQFQESHYILMS